MSPAASQEILHHTVWWTCLFIAYSDWKMIILPILTTSLMQCNAEVLTPKRYDEYPRPFHMGVSPRGKFVGVKIIFTSRKKNRFGWSNEGKTLSSGLVKTSESCRNYSTSLSVIDTRYYVWNFKIRMNWIRRVNRSNIYVVQWTMWILPPYLSVHRESTLTLLIK